MSALSRLLYGLNDLVWATNPRAAKYATLNAARNANIHGRMRATPEGVTRANGRWIPNVGDVYLAPAKFAAKNAALGLGAGTAAAIAADMYANEIADRANRVVQDPNSALAEQYREDARNEDAMPDLDILNNLRNSLGTNRTAPASAPAIVTAPSTESAPAVVTSNVEAAPVTKKRRKATPRIVSSSSTVAAPVVTQPSGLTEDQIIANELAMRRGWDEYPRPAQGNPELTGVASRQVPQFGNDELAVYDWQTGKPKLDMFGYQIRSADPRDHVGDPRWGTSGQGLTPEQAEELAWYYRN